MFQKRAFVAPLQSYEKRAGGLHARNGRPEGFKTFGSVYELYAWRVIAAAKQARGEVCGVSLMR